MPKTSHLNGFKKRGLDNTAPKTTPILPTNNHLPSLPSSETLKQLHYHDQLIDSLEKVEAMLFIFGCAQLEDFDEKMIQNFTLAVLDTLYRATDALSALDKEYRRAQKGDARRMKHNNTLNERRN